MITSATFPNGTISMHSLRRTLSTPVISASSTADLMPLPAADHFLNSSISTPILRAALSAGYVCLSLLCRFSNWGPLTLEPTQSYVSSQGVWSLVASANAAFLTLTLLAGSSKDPRSTSASVAVIESAVQTTTIMRASGGTKVMMKRISAQTDCRKQDLSGDGTKIK